MKNLVWLMSNGPLLHLFVPMLKFLNSIFMCDVTLYSWLLPRITMDKIFDSLASSGMHGIENYTSKFDFGDHTDVLICLANLM